MSCALRNLRSSAAVGILHGIAVHAAICLLAAPSVAAPRIALETKGGDAWTFQPQITGRVLEGTCDRVLVHSASGTVSALRLADRFIASVPLIAGQNAVHAECRQRDRSVAHSAPQIWRVPLPDTPRARVRIVIDDRSIQLDAGASETAAGRTAPLVRYEWFSHGALPAPLRIEDGSVLATERAIEAEHLALAIPRVDGEYYIRLRTTDALGRTDESIAVFRVADGSAHYVDLDSEHPTWVDRAVLYGAAPYMFEPQTFDGVRARLDEIAALGATVIWLSPVTAAAEDDFGYAVTDHFSVRARFGNAKSFRRFVDTAHRLGLRVIADFVPNHVSDQHPYYRDAIEHSRRSPYYDWFERDDEGEITQYFDWSHLKNLDYDNREVQRYMIEAFSRFVREFRVDGFRVDASWAVAARAPEFWPRLRAELKRIDPDIFLLAEASARDPYHVANGFDAAYDWTSQLGQWAWHGVFEEGAVDLGRLRAALTNEGRGFPPDTLILRFLNNNDTGERFASRHGADIARLAATLLFTLPGVPLIYNGQEMAAEFEPYDEGPPLEWNDAHPLVDHYRKLAALRQRTHALRSRKLEVLDTKQDAEVLAYVRPAESGDVLVLLNFSNRAVRVEGADPRTGAVLRQFSRATDLLSGTRINAVSVRAKSALILADRKQTKDAEPAEKKDATGI